MTQFEGVKIEEGLQRLSRIAPHARLRMLRMVEGTFKLGDVTEETRMNLTPDTTGFTVSSGFFGPDPHEGDQRIDVRIGVVIRRLVQGKHQDAELVVTANYRILYDIKEIEPSKEDLNAFSSINGLFNVWPYLREFLHSSAGRLEAGTVVLHTLGIADAAKYVGFEVGAESEGESESGAEA